MVGRAVILAGDSTEVVARDDGVGLLFWLYLMTAGLLIGAQVNLAKRATADAKRYRTYFPEVRLITPSP